MICSREKLIDIKEVAGRKCEVTGRNQLILLLKKTSTLSEKENMRNQMQMIRVREGAVGVGQTERAITPSSDTCPDSSGFGLLSGLGRKKI